ncbi:hypothetical protein I6N98_11040 [Spongiibacter nanhainus]|uniref:Type II secretion system protein C (GspC) n=1 Tax=Spongiibacter nanhainus TaxID=2794344 RepID=A0A7T4QY43_9GAMM|nr:hypothetical protein [Spongiibacter nanhainus]QQD16920.1 hypothetical protein I6N98_11040 [Spongiibacter nanhainus]
MTTKQLAQLGGAALCAGLTAGVLWLMEASDRLNPPTVAQRQEARIFNADDAQFFGEEPGFDVEFVLQARGQDAEGKYAEISIDGDAQKVRIGDTFYPPCVRLSALPEKAALVDVCGSYHLLWRRPESGVDEALGEEAVGAQAVSAEAARLVVDPATLGVGADGELAGILDYRDDPTATALLREYRQRLYQRPLSLRGKVDVKVGEQDDGRRAYFVWPGEDTAIFDQLPLEGGDQVVAVNGVALSSTQSFTDLYQRLDEADHLTVTLRRGNQDLVVLLGL